MKAKIMLKLLLIRARLGHFGKRSLVIDVIRILDSERKD